MSPRNGASPLPIQRAASPTSPITVFRPTHTLGAGRHSIDRNAAPVMNGTNDTNKDAKGDEDWDPPVVGNAPSHLGRSSGGLPRTLALDPTMTRSARADSPSKEPPSPVRVIPTSTGDSVTAQGHTILGGHMTMSVPLTPRATGTRYGAALGGRTASPMSPTWGGRGNPSCGKCGKTVYFAEQVSIVCLVARHVKLTFSQVKAIGKTYHKNCLRCTECNTTLDSARVTENEGSPYCKHCYGKVRCP